MLGVPGGAGAGYEEAADRCDRDHERDYGERLRPGDQSGEGVETGAEDLEVWL